MKMFNWFSKGETEVRSNEEAETLEDILLSGNVKNKTITKQQALNIPAVSACVNLISDTIASLPVYLYKEDGEKTEKVLKDNRVKLLNDETGDTLDGFQFKKALVTDFLLTGGGYAYINKDRNTVKSLHYVESENIAIQKSIDPIFKDYKILVNGNYYEGFDFIKMTRNSTDGVTGKGIIAENNTLLSVAYNSLVYENLLLQTGGNKKGFLKSTGRLSTDAIAELKEAWRKLYANNTENVVVLNNGLDFQEASSSSVELQLNENKKTNADEICRLFLVPPAILNGTASDDVFENWIKNCILPKLTALETAFNKDLLLTSEKEVFYFAFDIKELTKGDLEKRFKAYEIAVKNGWMQIDEIRFKEDLEPLGLEFIKLGLQDVLYNPKNGEVYTPNTNKTTNIDSNVNSNQEENVDSNVDSNVDDTSKGGENDEN